MIGNSKMIVLDKYIDIRDEAFVRCLLRHCTDIIFLREAKNLLNGFNQRLCDEVEPDGIPRHQAGFTYDKPPHGRIIPESRIDDPEKAFTITINCPSGAKRTFRMMDMLYNHSTRLAEHENGAKFLAFREIDTSNIYAIFPGSRTSYTDNRAVADAVLGDTINRQTNLKILRPAFDEMLKNISPDSTLRISGISLGAQGSVWALAYARHLGFDASLMLIEPFCPALMLKKVGDELAEVKNKAGISTTPLEEVQALWPHITDIRAYPHTVISLWPFGLTPWHSQPIGADALEFQMKENKNIWQWLYNVTIGHHDSLSVAGMAAFGAGLRLATNEKLSPEKIVNEEITAHRSIVEMTLAIATWYQGWIIEMLRSEMPNSPNIGKNGNSR